MAIHGYPGVRILLQPAAAWSALRAADPSWSSVLLRHVLPLALLPAIAWPAGQAAAGALPGQAAPLLYAFGTTLLFSVISVFFLALGLLAASPFFGCARNWDRSFCVAGYASTPVLAAGALLFVPLLVLAVFAAFAFLLVLCDMGVKALLGCRESDGAAFVASACTVAFAASMALGALCSAAGLI